MEVALLETMIQRKDVAPKKKTQVGRRKQQKRKYDTWSCLIGEMDRRTTHRGKEGGSSDHCLLVTMHSVNSLSTLAVLISLLVASNMVAIRALSRPLPAACLFDIDGTLVKSDPIHFSVFQELLLKEKGFNDNKPIDEEFFRKWISGRVNALITADFFPDWPIEKREQWSIRKEQRFREMAEATMMESKMPGLDRLRNWVNENSLGKAAVTNAPRLNAEAILSGIEFAEWFGDALIIGDECEKPKPDPCPYLVAAQKLGVSADQCIVFEDSPSGAKAGVAAGAFVVGVLSGQQATTLKEAGCDLIVQDFDDPLLWKHLESLSVATTSVANLEQ